MASSILPAEGLTLEFMAKPIGAILLQPLVTGVALLASLKYPSEVEQMLSTITKGAISALPLTRTLKVLVVAGIIYRLNRMFSRLILNNFVSDKTWDWKREIILITGGSSGIGALIAHKFSDRNVKVVIFDISAPKATLPANVHFYKVDITSSSAIHSAAETVRKEVGEPSVLINNAGVGWNREILQQTEAQIQLTFSVNIIAHFLMVREFAPAMIRRDHGHIVTIASMASFLVHAGNVDYAASKAAALAFHEGLAQELKARYGAKKVRTT